MPLSVSKQPGGPDGVPDQRQTEWNNLTQSGFGLAMSNVSQSGDESDHHRQVGGTFPGLSAKFPTFWGSRRRIPAARPKEAVMRVNAEMGESFIWDGRLGLNWKFSGWTNLTSKNDLYIFFWSTFIIFMIIFWCSCDSPKDWRVSRGGFQKIDGRFTERNPESKGTYTKDTRKT
jgi:hypothetical protein